MTKSYWGACAQAQTRNGSSAASLRMPRSLAERLARFGWDDCELNARKPAQDGERRGRADAFFGELAVEVVDGRHGLPREREDDVAVVKAGGRRRAVRLDRHDA